MKLRFKFTAAWFSILVVALLMGNTPAAVAGEGTFEAQLVWATNDENPPKDKDYQPVDDEIRKKLESLNLKWKSFYMVKKKDFDTKNGESGKVQISEKSAISVKLLEDKKVEVIFFGKKGEECSRRNQPLKTGDILVFGGNVPENATAWLVTLKRVK